MTMGLRRFLVFMAIFFPQARAQTAPPFLQRATRKISAEDFREKVVKLSGLVQACRDDPKACDPAAIGDDDKIVTPAETYQVRWQWLRAAIDQARNAASPNRNQLLNQTSARLGEELNDAQTSESHQPAFAPARKAADSILNRPEFRVAGGESWFDRKIAQFWAWVFRMFTAASDFGERAPWLGRALEWGFFTLTLVLVLVWVARTMRRERLALSLSGAMPSTERLSESEHWADLARIEAANRDWRAAIHCLYWATIVMLEGRRLWRRDPARTPREYIRLLEPESTSWRSLRGITIVFERIWYGIRIATQDDYTQVLALFEDLKRS
jgi:hypothetical protein